jgi:hypothetical protein
LGQIPPFFAGPSERCQVTPCLRKFPFIESDFRKPWQDFLLIYAAGLCIGKGAPRCHQIARIQ